ncbi:TPA: hypothetical protein IGZ61_005271 [Escherichia coli]|nr:hypothetical protein [Escherichia coli]
MNFQAVVIGGYVVKDAAYVVPFSFAHFTLTYSFWSLDL